MGKCVECNSLVLGTIRLWFMTDKKNDYVEYDGIGSGNHWGLSCLAADNHPGMKR